MDRKIPVLWHVLAYFVVFLGVLWTLGPLQSNWPAVSALGIFIVVAVIGLNFYLQKYMVRGMTYGAAAWE